MWSEPSPPYGRAGLAAVSESTSSPPWPYTVAAPAGLFRVVVSVSAPSPPYIVPAAEKLMGQRMSEPDVAQPVPGVAVPVSLKFGPGNCVESVLVSLPDVPVYSAPVPLAAVIVGAAEAEAAATPQIARMARTEEVSLIVMHRP